MRTMFGTRDNRSLTPYTSEGGLSLEQTKRQLPKKIRPEFEHQIGVMKGKVALGHAGLLATSLVHEHAYEMTMSTLEAAAIRMVPAAHSGTISQDEMADLMRWR